MHLLLSLILVILIGLQAFPAPKADNIIALEENNQYIISESQGEISKIKAVKTTVYTATLGNGHVRANEMFDDDISLDKASSAGVKPEYRAWEREDIFYDGSRICVMDVPIKKGKEATVTFELTYKNPSQFCKVFLASPYFTQHSITTIVVPKKLVGKITVEGYSLPEGWQIKQIYNIDQNLCYTIETTDRPAYRYEENAPSVNVDCPQLHIKGLFGDIGELYSFFRGYVDDESYGPDSDIGMLASELKREGDSTQDIIDRTVCWVRNNIRYLAVAHGDYGIRPATASSVLSHRAGDCKGSANLIKHLLRCNGIDGRLVWIGTRDKTPTTWEEFPSMASGNHMIAAAITGDSIQFIDGTTAHSPAGYIPPSIRGQQALIEDGDNALVRTVPQTSHIADEVSVEGHFRIEGDSLVGNLTKSFSGAFRMMFLSIMDETSSHRREIAQGRLMKYPKKNSTCRDIAIDQDADGPDVTITASVTELGSSKRRGEKIYLDLCPLRDMYFEIPIDKDRTHDYTIPLLYSTKFEYTVELPDGYTPIKLPEPYLTDNEWFAGEVRYLIEGHTLRCSASMRPKTTNIAVGRLPERNSEARRMLKEGRRQIILVKQ